MTYLEAVKLSIWPALCSTADVMVYGWALYSLVKWACSWNEPDEEEDFDPMEYAVPSGTGEPRPISHTIPEFNRPYNQETKGSRDGERE